MRVASRSWSANPPRPEPSTTATCGRSAVRPRRYSAARSARSNSPGGGSAAFTTKLLTWKQDAHDAGGNQVGHGPGEHGAETEAREVIAFVGRQRGDAADLNADGTEVRESHQGVSGDGEGARVEDVLLRPEHGERNQLVQHHAGAEQIANGGGVLHGDADEPRQRGEHHAEDALQAGWKPWEADGC